MACEKELQALELQELVREDWQDTCFKKGGTAMERNDSMTAKSWLCTGWQTYWKNKWALALGGLLWFAWDYVLCFYSPFVYRTSGIKILNVVVSLPFIIISVGLCFFCLKLSRGLEAPFSTIFEGFRRWWTALVTFCFILLVLIVAPGIIRVLEYLSVAPGIIRVLKYLLMVASIIWALKYLLALYAIMDRQLSAWEALKLSGRITTGYKGQLFYTVLISYGPPLMLGIGVATYAAHDPGAFSTCLGIAVLLVVGCVLDQWATCCLAVAYDRLSKAEDARGELDKT